MLGLGAVGARAARQLVATDAVAPVVLWDQDPAALARVTKAMHGEATPAASLDDALEAPVVVVATPSTTQPALAAAAIRGGADVVTTADGMPDIDDLLDLDPEAVERGRTIVVGAGFSPGLTCVLAAHAATTFDAVDEIHVVQGRDRRPCVCSSAPRRPR